MIAAIVELDKRGKADSGILVIKDQIILEMENMQIQQQEDFRKQSDIPKTISQAAKLIYLTLGIGLVNSAIVEYTTVLSNISEPKNLFVLIFTLAILGFLTYKIQMGRKWARTTFLVLFLFGLLIFPFTVIQTFELNPLIGIISLAQTGLQVYALILLYKPDSREWYINSSRKNSDD